MTQAAQWERGGRSRGLLGRRLRGKPPSEVVTGDGSELQYFFCPGAKFAVYFKDAVVVLLRLVPSPVGPFGSRHSDELDDGQVQRGG